MARVHVRTRGNTQKMEQFFRLTKKQNLFRNYRHILTKYAEQGLRALADATPVDTGKTASSWAYEIEEDSGKLLIRFLNTNIQNEYFNVALYLQYGHATKNGGWVEGIDYINPALQPIFQGIAEEAWAEVVNA